MLSLKLHYDGSDPVEKFGGDQLVQQEPDASSVFQMVELEIHLKQEVILLGIQHLQHLFLELLYVFQQFLFLIQVKH